LLIQFDVFRNQGKTESGVNYRIFFISTDGWEK
jgi:hypothetical protein